MSANAVTPANVRFSSAAVINQIYNAGVAITAGQSIYLDATNLWQLASTATGLGVAVPTAVAAANAAAGQRVVAVLQDPAYTHGLTGVAAGDTIWGSPTSGGFTNTAADNVATNFVTIAGIAISATQMKFQPLTSGVAK
jgi:hypothetical protein